jgi:hypothetical protein
VVSHRAALDLPFDQHRIHDHAAIPDEGLFLNCGVAGYPGLLALEQVRRDSIQTKAAEYDQDGRVLVGE